MSDKDNVGEILSELNKVLSNLTREEKEIVSNELKPEILLEVEKQQDPHLQSTKESKDLKPQITKQSLDQPLPQGKNDNPCQNSGGVEKPRIIYPPSISNKQVNEEIPKDQLFKTACFYPIGEKNLIDIFMNNLIEIIQKTTKKDYYIEQTLLEEIDFSCFDFGKIKDSSKKKGVEVLLIISPEQLEISSDDIYCQVVTMDNINKRFLYVDITVELMLIKKSSIKKD